MLNDSGISPTSAPAIHAPHYNLETRVDDPFWGNIPHRSPVDPTLLLRHPWTKPSAGNDGRRERERENPGYDAASRPRPPPPRHRSGPLGSGFPLNLPPPPTAPGSCMNHGTNCHKPQSQAPPPPFLWIPSSSLASSSLRGQEPLAAAVVVVVVVVVVVKGANFSRYDRR